MSNSHIQTVYEFGFAEGWVYFSVDILFMQRLLIIIISILLTYNCSETTQNSLGGNKGDIKIGNPEKTTDTISNSYIQPIVDTTVTAKEAVKLIAILKSKNDIAFNSGMDTLIDLNGDNKRDLLIEFYASAGTGIKNGTAVYLFNENRNQFLSKPIELPNPTFYLKDKTVVSYYVGNGGGYATKFKWNGFKLDTLEYIDINVIGRNPNLQFKSIIHNYITGKTTERRKDEMNLPNEYKYGDYVPIINRKKE
jgi:hypothetical protein